MADAFKAAALSVACLLNHNFEVERYRQSRNWDPIVGVSFTGLFDFFVHAFGTPWLKWWESGRPNTSDGILFKQQEKKYLESWKKTVKNITNLRFTSYFWPKIPRKNFLRKKSSNYFCQKSGNFFFENNFRLRRQLVEISSKTQ